jgi:outer membrane protein OmpA-like peptidoglycan-associated protein
MRMSVGSRPVAVLLAVTILMVAGGGCRKKPAPTPSPTPQPPPVVVQPSPTPPPPPRPSSTPTAPQPPHVPSDDEVFAAKSLDDLNRERPLADVNFKYDVADLTDASRATLQTHATWLRRWSTTRITIEGHADSVAPTNTTSRSASAGRRPFATTWAASGFPWPACRS